MQFVLKGNALVWKLCNFDDFTGSEIVTEPKVYVVLQYTVDNGRHTHSTWKTAKSIQKDGSVKTNVSINIC